MNSEATAGAGASAPGCSPPAYKRKTSWRTLRCSSWRTGLEGGIAAALLCAGPGQRAACLRPWQATTSCLPGREPACQTLRQERSNRVKDLAASRSVDVTELSPCGSTPACRPGARKPAHSLVRSGPAALRRPAHRDLPRVRDSRSACARWRATTRGRRP